MYKGKIIHTYNMYATTTATYTVRSADGAPPWPAAAAGRRRRGDSVYAVYTPLECPSRQGWRRRTGSAIRRRGLVLMPRGSGARCAPAGRLGTVLSAARRGTFGRRAREESRQAEGHRAALPACSCQARLLCSAMRTWRATGRRRHCAALAHDVAPAASTDADAPAARLGSTTVMSPSSSPKLARRPRWSR